MNASELDPLSQRVLRALYELAQADCPAHAGIVGRAVGIRPVDVGRVLLVLDARGLATADRARLTLRGLALAARLPSLQLARESWLVPAREQARRSSPRSSTPPPLDRCAGEDDH